MKKLLAIILCLCMIFSLASCGKKQGPQGEPGKDGITPTIEISDDGYWVINGIKTDVKAEATDYDEDNPTVDAQTSSQLNVAPFVYNR